MLDCERVCDLPRWDEPEEELGRRLADDREADLPRALERGRREGLLCFRRKLDTTEALVEEARQAGLDVERFRIDLGSHAIVEAFGADLEVTRTIPPEARIDRLEDGTVHGW